MSERTYHGNITPGDLAKALVAAFDQGNLRCQQIGQGERVMVQIATRNFAQSGGKAAMSITIQQVPGGVTVGVGQHEWLGAAASLGQTALATFRNPWNILSRLDDIAQDITSITLEQRVWDAIEKFARTARVTKAISERLSTIMCHYCETANKVGAASCQSCGAPLGEVQPVWCGNCGNVMPAKSKFCGNCGAVLGAKAG
jgi:hypothetical protein